MAKSASGGPDGLPQDPYVERLKPDPSQPARRVVELVGLPGNSDRPGYQRLYLTTKLDYYAEFLTSDMVHTEAVPADQSPFPGHEATRVSVSRDATIHDIWARSPQPVDEFDLDVRLGAPAAGPVFQPREPPTNIACHAQLTPPAPPCIIVTEVGPTCPPTQCARTCDTCQTCITCQTCQTCNLQATCAGHGTCGHTRCAQQTCGFTQCHGQTCLFTQCGQLTCVTCPGHPTCALTCVP